MSMPDIKPQTNVDKEREKKRGGLAGWWSRLTGRGGGAVGGRGGVGVGAAGAGARGAGADLAGLAGLRGAAASGGLLATKAGLIGLILAGSTVAAGVGVVGWNMFGPGQDAPGGPSMQLFASKPKASYDPSALTPVPQDGSSQSLSYAAQAGGAQEAKAEEASPVDASAASAADAAADKGENARPSMGESGGAGALGSVPRPGLNGARKLGELSKSLGGSGASSASAAMRPMTNAGGAAARSAGGGRLGGAMARGSAANARVARGLSRAVGGTATRQAMSALRDNRTAFSSQGGGRTYDGGGTAGGGVAGVDAGMPTGGVGTGGAGVQPTSVPNTAVGKNEFEAPPKPAAVNVTPWQKAINMAAMLLGLSLMLSMAAAMLVKKAKAMVAGPAIPKLMMVARIIAGLAAVLGMGVIALGAQISGGKYGQPLQGNILALGGAAAIAAAAMTITGRTPPGVAEGASPASGGIMGLNPFILLTGGAAAAALAGAMMTKPRSYPAEVFDGTRPPDMRLGYHYQIKPTDKVGEHFIA